ncbi:MAG: YdeI/OmpD-associated family protein, partial [Gemmataceae bacterium]
MSSQNSRVDAYIEKSADFAKPILTHLREIVHEACPDVQEEMKWSFPHFMYKGILCSMASFKAHCAFGFWKSSLIVENNGKAERAMGQFGRITKIEDLPTKRVLKGFITEAMKLNEQGVPSPTRSKQRRSSEVVVPDDLAAALEKNRKAMTTFEKFSPSHKREYVEWITEAKTEATRSKRLTTTL